MNEMDLVVAYKELFSSENGKLVLNDLMNITTFYRANFTSTEQLQYNEGARSVVLHIIKLLNLDVIQLRELIREDARLAQEFEA